MFLDMWPFHWSVDNIAGLRSYSKLILPSQRLRVSNISLARDETVCSPPIFTLGSGLTWFHTGFGYTLASTVSLYMLLSYDQKMLLACSHPSPSALQSFHSIFWNDCWGLSKSGVIYMVHKPSEISYFLNGGQLWVAVLIVADCKEKILSWVLKET